MEKLKELITPQLAQDLGMLGFLACMAAVIVSACNAFGNEKTECLVMFFIMCIPVLMCVYKMPLLSYALTGMQIFSYAVYKLYRWSAWREAFTAVSYAWLLIPVLIILSLSLYTWGEKSLELKNEVLREQVEELVMIDPLTGLYNRRAMYHDITKQISYSVRNDQKISLMVLRLKYEEELKRILSAGQFSNLRLTMAQIVEDTLRVEDRVYAVDQNGTLGIFLNCDKAGAGIVERRLKETLYDKHAFQNVVEGTIKVEVKVGYVEYESTKFSGAMEFFQKAENELQYDV